MNTVLKEADGAPGDLRGLHFEASFVAALPADAETHPLPRAVPGASYSRVLPTQVVAPRLLAWSDEVGELLGLARPRPDDPLPAQVLSGNELLPGMQPYAARYGGHQFGNWAGQLGDGRAITLGEVVVRGRRWELQLKGAGRTAYSRFADGRAVLRSSLREFLCSEAMHHLGVPTTRALSLVATGEEVMRDMFYDGNAAAEPGAIVCRVAPSFVRFGNFELHAAYEEHDALRRLADYVLAQHYPELGAPSPEVYGAWFAEVCRRTAVMLAHWMRVGFVHGVMNTDNMSILGLTIDYGPYGWLEGFDPGWTPNTTDAQGRRYRYGAQPQIAMWNLARLAGALRTLVAGDEVLHAGLDLYAGTFERLHRQMLAHKLGLEALDAEGDDAFLKELYAVLAGVETDMTIFFRRLALVDLATAERVAEEGARTALLEPLACAFYDAAALGEAHRARLVGWLQRYAARVRATGLAESERRDRMNRTNPKYVPRNYLAQLAIDAATLGDMAPLERLLTVLRRPYDEQSAHEELAARRPEWARHKAGCSALSCSS